MPRIIDKSGEFDAIAKTMQDGSRAWISISGRYYVRREYHSPQGPIQTKPWTHIQYYTLEGEYIPLAAARCLRCGDIVRSRHCGDFRSCSCGAVSVDTDRWTPTWHRYIGKEKNYEVLS